MEKKEILKEQGENILTQADELKMEGLAFIKDAMKELKDIHIFDNFDKDDGSFILDDDYNCEGADTIPNIAPIISVDTCMRAEDVYLIGVRYQENKNNPRYPYTIWLDCVPYDELSYVKFVRLEDVLSEYRLAVVNFITENI